MTCGRARNLLGPDEDCKGMPRGAGTLDHTCRIRYGKDGPVNELGNGGRGAEVNGPQEPRW